MLGNIINGDCCWAPCQLPTWHVQVGTAVLNTGEKLQCDLCLVGVGARPNLDLFQGKLDLLEDKPGGVKVCPSSPSQRRADSPCLLSPSVYLA